MNYHPFLLTCNKTNVMAILKDGIDGAFSGKVGTVVGYVANGKKIIRGLPRERTSQPTEKELLNRKKFAVSQQWLEPLTDFLRIGFKDYHTNFQGFVAAKSYNQKHALEMDENNEPFINPEKALVSFGNQSLPSRADVESKEGQKIVFTWNSDVKERAYAYNDFAMVVAYHVDSEKNSAYYHTGISLRKDGTATLTLREAHIGKAFHIYLAFVSDDRTQRSNSMYLGKVVCS